MRVVLNCFSTHRRPAHTLTTVCADLSSWRQKFCSHKLRDRHNISQVIQRKMLPSTRYIRMNMASAVVFLEHDGGALGMFKPPVCTPCNQQSITDLCPLRIIYVKFLSFERARAWRAATAISERTLLPNIVSGNHEAYRLTSEKSVAETSFSTALLVRIHVKNAGV